MLAHCLKGLGKWQAEGDWRRVREICARADAEARPITPCEEQQSHALDRRAVCLFIESSFEDSVKHYEREIERSIKDGKMPTRGYPKLLRMIASIRGGEAAQHAQVLLQKYFSPEGQRAIQEQVRKVPRPNKSLPKVPKARYHEIRLQKLVERFEEIGGVLLLDEGQVRYFVPEQTAVSRILVAEIANYHDRLRQRFSELIGKVDFEKIKAEICQRFPTVSLNPLELSLVTVEGAGNSAKPEGRKSHALA